MLSQFARHRPRQRRRRSALGALLAVAALFAAVGLTPTISAAQERIGASGLPLPRLASVRRDEANLRLGPGTAYAIAVVLTRRGLPVRIIGEHGPWRRVELHTGERGWIHRALLSGERRVVLLGDAVLYEARDGDALGAPPEATPLRPQGCEGEWCRVSLSGGRYWARRGALWPLEP